jgi:hypothetical protein
MSNEAEPKAFRKQRQFSSHHSHGGRAFLDPQAARIGAAPSGDRVDPMSALALFGRKRSSGPCRLVGVKQTSLLRVPRSVFYPRRTTDHLPRAPWIIASGGHRYCLHSEIKRSATGVYAITLSSRQEML